MKLGPRLLALALPVVLVLMPWQTRADDKPKAKDTKAERDAVMLRKLGYAKDLLEGLSLQDYDKLTKSAEGLIRCREEVTWRLEQFAAGHGVTCALRTAEDSEHLCLLRFLCW